MKKTKKSKANNKKQLGRDFVEGALEIVIRNAVLDSETIKALRLTCKRTKAAADARVKQFTLSLENEQNSDSVKRSGLLNNITDLDFGLICEDTGEENYNHAQRISRAVGLLNLAVDICSKSAEVLTVGISASPDNLLAFGCILGNCKWASLKALTLDSFIGSSMPGFLSGVFAATPGGLPALRSLSCQGPSAADMDSLAGAACVSRLTSLTIKWSAETYECNVAPATVAAMRKLLQKATNLESLNLTSSTFDYFDCEQLSSLNELILEVPGPPAHRARVGFAPVLARPWKTLDSLSITYAVLTGPDLIRIFEAEDTLPVLGELSLHQSRVNVDALSCLRRPHLQLFWVLKCRNGHELISKLAQLMKEDTRNVFPRFQNFGFNCSSGEPVVPALEALSDLISSPCMATVETLSIYNVEIGIKGSDLLCDMANHCPKLMYLEFLNNNLGRPAVALLLGYGKYMGAWPELKKLGGLIRQAAVAGPNNMSTEHPYMSQLDVQATLRSVWPGLECY